MKIMLDGGNGLLGYDVAKILSAHHDTFVIKGRRDLDLNDFTALREKIESEKPDCYIHIAGIKDVDDAQRDPVGAYALNTIVPANIALVTGNMGIPMIHISTGGVFDGNTDKPYKEDDPVAPVNTYGNTKLKAEELVRYFNPKSFIIRVPLLFGAHGGKDRNPILKMLSRLEAGERGLLYTTDQISNPTYVVDIAYALEEVLESDKYGTYHLCNTSAASRYEYFSYIAHKMGYGDDATKPCLMGVKFAPREKNVVLDGSLFENTFHHPMRTWMEAMDDCIKEIKSEN
ncbi:MAG: NAD(P)-dependent oxidoreductase [Erysipelotrichaceae bacterium]|nr:NAD(P)-dependent oxidoreductase [Erysipelotrichaceae bacterium]